jgi:hypothetical protein
MRLYLSLISLFLLLFTFVFDADGNTTVPTKGHINQGDPEDLSFMLSPNPVRRGCVLQVNQTVDLVILDLRGQEIQRIPGFSGGSLDLKDLEEGIYFLQLITPNVVRTQRLVKVEERN